MKLIIVLALLQLAFCGHIYVSDPQLSFQNIGYVTSAQLYFKLETELQVGEIMKITWPYQFNSTASSITAKIKKAGSTATPTGITALLGASDLEYLIVMSEQLDAGQWYTLNLSTTSLQSPAVQYYNIPIKMSTHSGKSGTSVDNYALYDYNNMCGFIAVAQAPVQMQSVVVSTSATVTTIPGETDGYKDYEYPYSVYVTILTADDYDYGGIYYVTLSGGFTWDGTCDYYPQSCNVDATSCTTVKTLTTKEYACSVAAGTSQLTFARFQNSTKYAINKNEPLKFKAGVKNPSRKDSSAVNVQLVSHYAKFIYELYTTTSTTFQTTLIALNSGDALYFWGLPYDNAASRGCPVRIYTSTAAEVAVWNKIWLPFAPNRTLPSSTQGFKLRAKVTTATWINDVSIYTDAGAFGTYNINCYSLVDTDSYIDCLYLGQLQANQTKYLRFSFMMVTTDWDATNITSFGRMQIYFMDGGAEVTDSKIPSKIPTDAIKSVMYSSQNAVLSKDTATTVTNLVNVAHADHRSSIVYPSPSTAKVDLVFLLTTTYAIQCCPAALDNTYCTATNANCAVQRRRLLNEEQSSHDRMLTAHVVPNMIVKIIANPTALSLSTKDDSNSDQNVYKGVEVLPGLSPDKFGTFGAIYHATKLCQNPEDTKICSSNTAAGTYYITYAKALGSVANEKYLFNQWHNYDNKYELNLVCYSGTTLAAICGGFLNTQTDTPRGIVMKDVQLSIQANPLYPSQKELDFIMCLRYSDSTSLKYTDTTSLATSSLINAQLINFRQNTAISDQGTFFKIGVLNYYAEAGNYNYVPTLLRVGGYMQASDIKDNSGIAFFFDGANIVINSQGLSGSFPLLPTECSSTTSTKPTCKYYSKNPVKATAVSGAPLHLDYYPGLNVITISGTVASQVEFNYYIPVQIKAVPFTTAFIGLLSKVQPPEPSIVFKLYGTIESYTNTYVDFAVAANTQFTDTALLASAADGTDVVTSLAKGSDWENTDITKYGIVNEKNADNFTKVSPLCYSQTPSDILPEQTASAPYIDATQTGVWADKFNDDTALLATTLRFVGSVHFTVHSSIKFWSSTFDWSITNKAKKPFTGACADMAITSYKTSTVNATSYLIVCPYEGTFTTTDTTTKAGLKIENFTWTWPDYFGKDAPVGAYLRYLWTDKLGNLKAFVSEAKKGVARTDCATLGDLSSVYALSTNQKKSQINITPLSSLKLLKATQGKSKMVITLTTILTTTNSETTQKCSVSFDKVQCTFAKSSNVYTFTLTNTDTLNAYTITKAAISITFWISSSASTDTATTYTAKINGYFYDNYPEQLTSRSILLADCSSSATWGYTTAISRSLTIDDLVTETSIANARGFFSFKFSSSNDFLDESKFTIDLSLLSTSNSLLMKNLRCLAYKSNTVSHDFALFDFTSLSAISLEYRTKYSSTLARPYEYSSIAYEFKCTGGKVPDTIASLSKIHVTNLIGSSLTAEGYSADQSTKTFTTISTSVATVSMTKTFNYTGQEATYTFKVITKQVADSPSTIQFKAGSYLYVEFARDINPRFNKLGIIRCYQESEPTYCSYESERRIAFVVRTDLNHNKTEGYSFSIVGVNQPASLANYNTMYVALVPYLGTLKTLLFQDNSTIIDTITADSGTVTTLEVTQYEQSTTDIRSTYQFTMTIRFPINSVQDNIPIWVDLPEEFDEATFLGWTPSCKLQNVKVLYNETITNYVTSCSLTSTRRIKIILSNATSYTAKKLFQLTIGSIPTYNYEQVQVNAPIVWFGNTDNQYKPLYKTNLGNFNGTYNMAPFTYSDTKYKLITWKSTTVTCIVGTYQCFASLIPQVYERFYLDLSQVTSSGSNSSQFSFNPSTISVTTGKTETKFEIAPKASTAPGQYQLKWTHEAPTSYYVIPPLFIVALNTQIKPKTNEATYEVPNKGRSLPIIFDFTGTMPETDVTVTGVAESLSATTSLYETSPYVTFQSASQTLTYSESSVQTQIQFVVKADKGTTETDLLTARLSWTISGTNSKSYATPDTVTVTIVNAPEGTPELTLNTPDSNTVGAQTIIAKCSHTGVLYYVISQGQSLTQIEYTAIKAASEDKNVLETEIETVYTNPSRTFYGYDTVTIANSDNSITISGKFQSQAKYYMRMYCVNLASVISVPKDVSWTQASNNGKPMISTMQFTSTNATSVNTTTYVALNDTQRKEIACVICKETQIEKNRVFAINGVACGETGAVSTANTTTANKTTRILLVENATSEYFVVMPDLFLADGSLDTVKATLESTAFQTTLTSNTLLSGFKMQAISCSINSAYPATPYISSPSVSPSESSITFTWTGANNTDGFVFVGVVATTNGTVVPTELQLKKNSGYSFTGFNKAFYSKDKSVAVTVSSVTKCSDYSYYWAATNEDPDTFQYSTGVKQGTTKTIGCPTSASMLVVKMLGLLVLFAMLI